TCAHAANPSPSRAGPSPRSQWAFGVRMEMNVARVHRKLDVLVVIGFDFEHGLRSADGDAARVVRQVERVGLRAEPYDERFVRRSWGELPQHGHGILVLI